jgi:hypothetical protein
MRFVCEKCYGLFVDSEGVIMPFCAKLVDEQKAIYCLKCYREWVEQ